MSSNTQLKVYVPTPTLEKAKQLQTERKTRGIPSMSYLVSVLLNQFNQKPIIKVQ